MFSLSLRKFHGVLLTRTPPVAGDDSIKVHGQTVDLTITSRTRLLKCGSALALIFLCSALVIAQQKYSITDIGNLGGDPWPYAAISNSGHITGASQTSTGSFRSYIWDKTSGIRSVQTPCTGANADSYALGVNGLGQVTGICFHDVRSDPTPVPFVSDSFFGVRILPLPTDACGVYPRAINGNGTVTGDLYYDCQLMRGHGFLWEGTMHDLISLGGPFFQTGSYAAGFAINKDGIVAGFSTLPDAVQQRAVIWGPNGIQNLGTLDGDSIAFGINDSQQVVGSFSTTQSEHGFIWDSGGGMRDLGTLAGGFASRANGINNNSQVVGRSNSSDPASDHAFVWNSRDGMQDLNDLIPADSGWLLVEATAINDRGQIAGWGFHNGAQAIFVVSPVGGPLIFIPGVTGSYLVDRTTGSERWPGFGTFHDSLTLDPNAGPNPNIIATDVLRSYVAQIAGVNVYQADYYAPLLSMLKARGGYREYDVNNDPNRRTTAGCDLNQKSADPGVNPNLFVFAYDWRRSSVENAAKLRDYVGCVQQFYPDTKVDIVTHSMGGLVARRYILDNPGKVRKLISIGTPWVGAPKSILALETGETDAPSALVWRSTIKTLADFFTSIHEILPSAGYFDLGGLPFVEKGDFNRNGIPDESYNYGQERDLLNQRHSRSLPGTNNLIFHNYPGEDDWRGDASGVEYHHILGEQHLNQTIGQVIAQRITVCRSTGFGFDCDDEEFFDTKMTNGDRTVPKRSASRIGTVVDNSGEPRSVNFNTPLAKLWYFWSLDNNHDGLVEHTALTQFPQVHDLVLYLLDQGSNPDIEPISKLNPLRHNQGIEVAQFPARSNSLAHAHHIRRRTTRLKNAIDPPVPPDIQQPSPKSPAYYIKVTGVDFVSVTDEHGNTNTRIDYTFARPVPNVTYDLIGDKAVLVSAPTDIGYTIRFTIGTDPINLEVLKGIDNVSPTEAVRYRDAIIPSGATALLTLTAQGIGALQYDADGDGNFEGTLSPTVSLIGSNAADTTPPTVTITGVPQQQSVLITIAAQDSGTGLNAIYYSLDRRHYQRYIAPFPVNPLQPTTVYAFADDNAANRSAMILYVVPPLPSGSPLSALSPAQMWIGLKNSDDVGTKFDLLAEVLKDGVVVGSGQLNDVSGGSSGFNNAKPQTINLALVGTTNLSPGETIAVRLSIRIAASSGHRSGTARLWFNDAAANSRFGATIGGVTNTYFLQTNSILGKTNGTGPKNTIDVLVDRAVAGNPFKPFGSWSLTF